MKNSTSVVISLLILLFTSCKTYYGDGLVGGIYTPMHSQMADKDTSIVKHTIGVTYNQDIAYYLREKNQSGELSFHRSVSKPKVNYAFGGGLYAGTYDVKNLSNDLEKLNKKYIYHGGIVRAKVAYNAIKNPNFHWRVIGIQGAWYLERGPFLDFKNDLINTNNFDTTGILKHGTQTVRDFSNISLYPYTEFIFKAGESFTLSPSLGFGTKINEILGFRGFLSLGISYKNKLNMWATHQKVGSGFIRQLNNQFLSQSTGNNVHSQIGISYFF